MEIFMKGINYTATRYDVIYALKDILHSPSYAQHSSLPLNFEVHLFRDKRGRGSHNGRGALTLPTVTVGNQFLVQFGFLGVTVRGRRVQFSPSKNNPRPDVVEKINRLPYIDPRSLEEQEARARQLQSDLPSVTTVQFGWHCRDETFSIEWERDCSQGCRIYHDAEQKQFRVKTSNFFADTVVIAIRFPQIQWCAAGSSSNNEAALVFDLWEPPVFESEPSDFTLQIAQISNPSASVRRKRLSAIDEHHEPYAAYTSLAMRLVCPSRQDINTFKENCRVARMQVPKSQDVDVNRRGLFTLDVQEKLQSWLKDLPWSVAYQVTSLVKSLVLDIPEMLSLRKKIKSHIERSGEEYTSALLRHFAACLRSSIQEDVYDNGEESIEQCFDRAAREHELQFHPPLDSENIFYCQHASVTPTTVLLEGPYPERSNRVIRQYAGYHDWFLRVSFVEEGRLQYRFDRDVDGADFVRQRVGKFLKSGIEIAGRTFQFLAYSNSALKDHAVWFVSPFHHPEFGHVDAQSIINGIGTFNNVTWDRKLMYCPARYGARISQAFTATDASISVEAEEIMRVEDIERNGSCFTDGVGTISKELARDVWRRLRKRPRTYPSAFQVRLGGSKGMLSVDHKLSGRAICLRYSMIKFEAPESRNIEIARAFDRPGKYYLNRPLIMLLEGLGVPYEVFKTYQDNTVEDAHAALQSFSTTATLLESYGLGASFRLSRTLRNLHKLAVVVPEDPFYEQMIGFVMHHILRELKHHARILVPGGWTLVGVADVHRLLQDGEIFACVQESENEEKIYLEGRFLISRSPTIHPGDVQIVRAIGRPPQGSCFEKETLTNTVVFSVLGNRSLPSMLGGGDLDGDLYNLVPLKNLPISTVHAPAEYPAAPKKYLDRPSTLADVADFVIDYINSDVLGIVAINWLIIADQSQESIFDKDCLALAALHSDAVDFQKSGQPVPLDKIPRLKFKEKPDWNAPETIAHDPSSHYKSQRAIGKLFREIDLPALQVQRRSTRLQYRQFAEGEHDDTGSAQNEADRAIHDALSRLVTRHIPLVEEDAEGISHTFDRFSSDLFNICATHTLSNSRTAMLTEEEAVIGTIVAKSSQPRRRKELMSKLREQTDHLVRGMREQLAGDDDSTQEQHLNRAWFAWKLSIAERKRERFGAHSFGWIALGAIFEAIGDLEGEGRLRHL